MSEDNKKSRPDKNKGGITRRQFLELAATTGASLLLVGCGVRPEFLEKQITPEEASKLTQEGLDKIRKIREHPEEFGLAPNVLQNFMKMVNDTYPGISLTYWENPYIKFLRKKPLSEAILFAIAGLNLMGTSRYNRGDIYTCNIYALDLVRALLGNNVIGDRYNSLSGNGEPISLGLRDLDWNNNQLVEQYNRNYPFLHGNNFDWWAKNYGGRYGWERLTLGRLPNLGGDFIGVYCTSQEEIERQRRSNPNFFGHMGVIFNPFPDKSYILTRSQATNHYPFEVLTTDPLHPLIQGILKGNFEVYFHAYNSS